MFLSFTTTMTFAQAQFNASNCFQLNDSAKLGFAVVSQSFDNFIAQTGSSYTWDFTTTGTPGPWTSWTSPTALYKFQPSSASIHLPFASTEINEYASLPFARDHFYTYSTIQDTLYCDGFYTSSDKVYLPRIPYLTFPLNYSDSVYTQTTQTGGTALGPGVISRYWIYDGFGTVKFPYGTESNVYRIEN
ncbi:hypothetical protein BH10BAC1_BH10BAC1_13170 [soil metagenome]